MKMLMAGFLAVALFGAPAQTAKAGGWSLSVSGGFCAAPVAGAVIIGAPPPVYVYSRPTVCAPTPVVFAPPPVVYAPRPVVVYSAPVYVRPAPVVWARYGHGWHHHHFRERGCW